MFRKLSLPAAILAFGTSHSYPISADCSGGSGGGFGSNLINDVIGNTFDSTPAGFSNFNLDNMSGGGGFPGGFGDMFGDGPGGMFGGGPGNNGRVIKFQMGGPGGNSPMGGSGDLINQLRKFRDGGSRPSPRPRMGGRSGGRRSGAPNFMPGRGGDYPDDFPSRRPIDRTGGGGGSFGDSGGDTGLGDVMTELLQKVNDARSQVGARALTPNRELLDGCEMSVQQQRAAQKMTHTPGGRDPRSRGYDGENVAWGYDSVGAVMDQWMHSSGHRKNILNPQYSLFAGCALNGRNTNGMGSAGNRVSPFWTQAFRF